GNRVSKLSYCFRTIRFSNEANGGQCGIWPFEIGRIIFIEIGDAANENGECIALAPDKKSFDVRNTRRIGSILTPLACRHTHIWEIRNFWKAEGVVPVDRLAYVRRNSLGRKPDR